jgi:hypothetical protein
MERRRRARRIEIEKLGIVDEEWGPNSCFLRNTRELNIYQSEFCFAMIALMRLYLIFLGSTSAFKSSLTYNASFC